MSSVDDWTSVKASDPEDHSALLAAARQLSEEAALRPRVAGPTGARQRAAATRSRRAARHMAVMPAA